jgi:hypothetical protein
VLLPLLKKKDWVVQFVLQDTYCSTIVTDSTVAMSLTVEQTRILESCWNAVCYGIFGFNLWNLVKAFKAGLGQLDMAFMWILC